MNDTFLFEKLRFLNLPVLGCYGDGRVEFERLLNRNEARSYRDVLRRHTFCGSLSPMQVAVLKLLAEGKANKQIAVILQIRVEMAAYHVAQILKAFKADSRAQAVAIAFRAGILK